MRGAYNETMVFGLGSPMRKTAMDAEISEGLFASYLESHDMSFERHFLVCGEKNVDFKIDAPSTVLCDVKEVHDSRMGSAGKIDAYTHIREDLKDLRKKFRRKKPPYPVVLITMNFSSKFFTAHTVARAMFGDIGTEFIGKTRGEIHHLPRGNASMTRSTNTSISGVFVYDRVSYNHAYFPNEFAELQIPTGYFHGVVEIDLKRSSGEQELARLSKLMFWDYDDHRKP